MVERVDYKIFIYPMSKENIHRLSSHYIQPPPKAGYIKGTY